MSRRRVALATYARALALAPDDRSLLPAFAALGVDAVPAVWTDRAVAWDEFDAVLIRSCWDYHRRFDEFRAWLARLESSGVRVWNPPAVIRWNATKSYLRDLASRGVPTIPTLLVTRDDRSSLEAELAARDWRTVVVKPSVSASGYETHALTVPFDAEARAIVDRVTSLGDVLIQPFAEEVRRDGELSLVFLAGEYSHAALKRATGSEFRVQEEHGGTLEPIEPDGSIVAQGKRALAAAPGSASVVYARVDGIVREHQFMLMELELIEPNLFLGMREGAAKRLAESIHELSSRAQRRDLP